MIQYTNDTEFNLIGVRDFLTDDGYKEIDISVVVAPRKSILIHKIISVTVAP